MRRVYTYNENKNLIKVKSYTPEGQLIGTLRYLRDEEKGQVIEQEFNNEGLVKLIRRLKSKVQDVYINN